jgi:hypothetical protein
MNPATATATATRTALDLTPLRDALAGAAFGPGDPEWDVARSAWNLAVDQHPAAVALPESAEDVVAAVRFAREARLRVAVQGTGHNAAAYGDLGDSLLIKTERMRSVEVDPAARTARVGAGVTWGEVVGPAAEHGLAALAGSSHDVGVVGYALGGGVSWLARKHGLAADRIASVEIVTADGELRRAAADENEELFWALRGGGGNFGVVTAMEIELLPVRELYAGSLFFPLERAGEVLEAWRRWTANLPDEATSVGRVLQFPPLPEVPEPLRGNSFTVVEMAYLGDEERGAELIRPLRELGPAMDTFAMIGPAELLQLHMDPPAPVPGIGDHQMLADLDAGSLEAVVEAVGPGSGSPLVSFEFRHIGGALARRREGGGSLGALEGRYMSFGVGIPMGPESVEAIAATLGRAREALDVVDNGSFYGNFAESEVEPEEIWGERTLRRLREVKASVDPDGLLHGNHPVAAA